MTMSDVLKNAYCVKFPIGELYSDIPTVSIVFKDWTLANAFYREVYRSNNEREQHFRFTKNGDKLDVAFILNDTKKAHTIMSLDYDKSEFKGFIKRTKTNDKYIVTFSQIVGGELFYATLESGDVLEMKGYEL